MKELILATVLVGRAATLMLVISQKELTLAMDQLPAVILILAIDLADNLDWARFQAAGHRLMLRLDAWIL
jgi:hypothetical protein